MRAETKIVPVLAFGMARVAVPERVSPSKLMNARLPLRVAWFEGAVKNMGRLSAVSLVSTSHEAPPLVESSQLEPGAQLPPPPLLVKLAALSDTLV